MISGSVQYRKRKDGKRVYSALLRLNGRQKRERIGAVNLYEAERYLRKRIEELERNFSRDLKKATFDELAKEWLIALKLDAKPHTISSYEFQVNKHLIPFFGKMPVNKIFPEDVERFK